MQRVIFESDLAHTEAAFFGGEDVRDSEPTQRKSSELSAGVAA